MKKLLAVLALLLVASMLLVACQTNPEGPEETTPEETTPEVTTPEETTPEDTTPEETTPEDTTPEETTPEDTTPEETTPEETTPPADPVTVHISKDELRYMIGEEQVGAGFPAGQFTSWTDMIATVEDYKVEYLVSWGWASFYGEAVGQFGYQIDDNAPVYDDAFAWETEQPVLDAAGGKPASRYKIYIPVRDLQGEHTIKALVKDAVGTEEVMYEFTMNKAVDPDAPLVVVDPATLITTATGAPDVSSAVLSADGTYATLTNGTVGDPYITFRQINVNAQYLVVKYRTNVAGKSFNFFVASTGNDATGNGDMAAAQPYECDGKWHLAIVDISPVAAVNEENFISFFRYDFYTDGQNQDIDVAYIAAFNSIEAAQAYDAKFNDVYVDTLNVPTSDWVITGHRPALQDSSDNMVAAGGVEYGALLHQGAIYVGDLNLAEMSKVVVFYGLDGSQTTIDVYNANAANRIILSKVDTNNTLSPAEEDIIASVTYTELGWAVKAIEIDLTDVDYNGPVYVTYDTLPGTFMLISSVEFTYDNNYTEPEVPEMETIYYDGTNGSTIVPVEGVKYFVRGAAGMTLSIQGAYNFVVTADNLMGASVVLQPDRFGNIEVEVPADWFTFELTIDNVCGEPAEFNMTITEPAPIVESLIVGENIVNATVTTSGWNDVSLYYFTAPVAGTYYFTLSNDYASGSLYYAEAPIYGMVEQFPLVLDLEAGQTIELGVSADVIMGDLIGATEDIVYGLGLIISDTAPATDEEVVVEDIVLSVDTLGLENNSYAAGTATLGGVDFEYIQMGNYGDGLQMRDKNGNTSSIWNTSAFAAGIAKIELVYSDSKDVAYSNADAVIFTFGNEAQGATYTTKLSTTAGEKTYTITPDADTYTFFKLEHDLGYTMYWKSITIVFADGTTVSA